MPTLNDARSAVYSRWTNAAVLPFSRWCFDNEKYDPPPSNWARVSVLQLGSEQETLGPVGGRRYNRRASVIIKLYGPIELGAKPLDLLAQTTRNLFEGVTFSELRFSKGVLVREGQPDGRWDLRVVEAEFDYPETK